MHHRHTHITQRLRYKWSGARLGHSSTQSARGDGLRFSLTQMHSSAPYRLHLLVAVKGEHFEYGPATATPGSSPN